MRRLPLLLTVLVVLAAGSAGAQPMTDDGTLGDVVSYLDEQRTKLGVPGMAVAIVRGEQVLLTEGLGEANPGRAVEPDQPFLINSMSKSITALALVQLVEQGLVDLDDPVTDHVPDLAPGADGVTVRDLLHHTSGLPQYEEVDTISAEMVTLEATVLRLEPLFGVVDGFAYTNGAYDTLALVVERVSGVPFGEYVATNVFEPLAMESSLVGDAGRQLPRAVEGHYKWLFAGYRPFVEVRPGTELGSAKMWSTAEDMARYLMVHLNGGSVDGVSLVSLDGLELVHRGLVVNQESGLEYGGGLWRQPGDGAGVPEAFRDGATIYHGGSSDTFRSTMWVHPESGLGLVILANGNDQIESGWVGQLAYEVQRIMSGDEPADVVPTADPLNRASKWIAFGLVAAQVVLALASIPVLRRGGRPSAGGWVVLAAATIVDLATLGFLLWAPRAVGNVPLDVVMRQPDLRILVWAAVIMLGWGAVRTVVVASRVRRPDPRPVETTP